MNKLQELYHFRLREMWAGGDYMQGYTAVPNVDHVADHLVELGYVRCAKSILVYNARLSYLTESGLAYCREHFGEGGQNA